MSALRADAPTWSGGASGSGSGGAGGSGAGGSAPEPAWLALPKPTQRLPGALVPFLAQDNDEASEAAAEVASSLNAALAHLLALPPQQFWAYAVHEPALRTAVDTYLRFRRRPHDGGAAPPSAESDALARRVFMVLLRLVTPERGGPPADAHATLLQRHALLDLPRLMDACTLFGPDNGALTSRLARGALTAAPWLRDAAVAAGAAATSSVAQLAFRCDTALAVGAGAAAPELADAVAYFADVAVSLAALARAAPDVAPLLLSGEGAGLLPALATAHDRVAPAVSRYSPALAAAAARAQAAARDAAAELLHAAYLAPRGGGDDARAARRDGLLLTALSMDDAADAPATLLRRVGAAPAFRAALLAAAADLRVDAEQASSLQAAFGLNDAAATRASGSGASASASSATEDADLASRLTAVRDVLPDCGEGFVAACLAALGGEPERVVHALLEGALPPAVASLPRGMSLQAYRASRLAQQPARDAKGKGKAPADWQPADHADDGPAPARAAAPPPPLPPQRAAQPAPQLQAYRKKGERQRWERDEALQLLDTVDAAADAASRAAAHEAQLLPEEEAAAASAATADNSTYTGNGVDEYDDEYDDSFDDLGVSAAEAATDADGDGDADASLSRAAAPFTPAQRPAQRPAPVTRPVPAARTMPAPRPPPPANAPGGRPSSYWVLSGRVYSYAKEGAEQVTASSAEEASRIAAARAAEAASLIHGLGAGGNRGTAAADGSTSGDEDEEEGSSAPGGGRGGGGGRGRGRGLGGGDAGGRSHARKEQHKAAVGNHHRKDRAAQKQRALLGPT